MRVRRLRKRSERPFKSAKTHLKGNTGSCVRYVEELILKIYRNLYKQFRLDKPSMLSTIGASGIKQSVCRGTIVLSVLHFRISQVVRWPFLQS